VLISIRECVSKGIFANTDKLGVGQVASVHTLWQKTNTSTEHIHIREWVLIKMRDTLLYKINEY